MAIDSPPVFPVLCVARDFGVYVAHDQQQLRQARAGVFRRGHFEGLRVFDAAGRVYNLAAARITQPASAAGRWLARVLDLTVTVDVEIVPAGAAQLPEVVAAVEKAIDTDPESFEELSGRSVEWWRATLARAASIQDVVRAFEESRR